MPLNLPPPILYAITSGATNSQTSRDDEQFVSVLHLAKTAVSRKIPLLQIREKNLPTRMLYELVSLVAEITRWGLEATGLDMESR